MIDSLNSPYIQAATSDNFKALVVDNSSKGPVLVNFWSKKAGPCLRQYPILDQLIHQYDGRVLLVNIDTEAEFIFTKEYGVTSVPTLKLFRDGLVVETLHGFQSERDIRKVLDSYVARDSDLILADAIQLYTEGKAVAAYEMIANAIIEDPVNHRLPLTVCKLLKHEERYAEAIRLINSLPEDVRRNSEITQFNDVLTFFAEADSAIELDVLTQMIQANPADLDSRRQLVVYHVTQQQYEQALQELVIMIAQEKDYGDKYAQQAMLRIFNILGAGHPLIGKFRKNLQHYTH